MKPRLKRHQMAYFLICKIYSIWSLEHFPVFTIGISEKQIIEDKTKNPPFIKTDRGGKTTFHAPGQLVFYFILHMKKLP